VNLIVKLRIATTSVATLLLLSACGQTGALYLPKPAAQSTPQPPQASGNADAPSGKPAPAAK
jgi:predicted small lipoprotein YifL